MKTPRLITRRRAIVAGLAAVGGLLRRRATRRTCRRPTATCCGWATHFTYAAHRALLPGQSLVREYSRGDITSFPATGTTDPGVAGQAAAQRDLSPLQSGGVRRLAAVGRGPRRARRGAFSLAELKQLPSRTQITRHTCEEGWTAIGEWTGVPLSRVLDAAGILPTARFVVFYSFDDWVDSIDLLDALHPQTHPGLRHERPRSADAARRAGAAARRTADGLQEHEVPPPHRRDRRVRRRRGEGQHPERVGVVHGDLNAARLPTRCSS